MLLRVKTALLKVNKRRFHKLNNNKKNSMKTILHLRKDNDYWINVLFCVFLLFLYAHPISFLSFYHRFCCYLVFFSILVRCCHFSGFFALKRQLLEALRLLEGFLKVLFLKVSQRWQWVLHLLISLLLIPSFVCWFVWKILKKDFVLWLNNN